MDLVPTLEEVFCSKCGSEQDVLVDLESMEPICWACAQEFEA